MVSLNGPAAFLNYICAAEKNLWKEVDSRLTVIMPCFESDSSRAWRVLAPHSLQRWLFFSTFYYSCFKSDDDSSPEDGQSSSGDEELEPEADQLSSRGKLKNNQTLYYAQRL